MGKVGEGPGTLWCGQAPRLVGNLGQHEGNHRPWESPASLAVGVSSPSCKRLLGPDASEKPGNPNV